MISFNISSAFLVRLINLISINCMTTIPFIPFVSFASLVPLQPSYFISFISFQPAHSPGDSTPHDRVSSKTTKLSVKVCFHCFGVLTLVTLVIRDIDFFSIFGLIPQAFNDLLSYTVTCLNLSSAAYFLYGMLVHSSTFSSFHQSSHPSIHPFIHPSSSTTLFQYHADTKSSLSIVSLALVCMSFQ